nr:septum formation family protein [Streptomyces sp. 15-116A]
MAVAGSVLSSVGLALWVVALTTGAAADVWQGFKDGAAADSVLALRKGDCFNSPGGLDGWTTEAARVPCARAHDGEVFAVLTRPDGAYPGDDVLTDLADERCYALQDAYVMDSWALPDDVAVYYLVPSRQSWRYGDREITCVFGKEDGRSKLTGSLRKDETTLDAHQVTYLEAAQVLNAAMEKGPVTEAGEEDLPAQRKWAREVADALTEQTGMLREHRWPDDARRPVSELAEELERAEKEWSAAAEATDLDTYYEHYDKGWALLDARKTVTAREALGLATTPPDPEEAEERDSGGGSIEV